MSQLEAFNQSFTNDWLASPSHDNPRAKVETWIAKFATGQEQFDAASKFINHLVQLERQETVVEVTWEVLRVVTERQLWRNAYSSLKEFNNAHAFNYTLKRMLSRQGLSRAKQQTIYTPIFKRWHRLPQDLLPPDISPPKFSDGFLRNIATLSGFPQSYDRCVQLLRITRDVRLANQEGDTPGKKHNNNSNLARYAILSDVQATIDELKRLYTSEDPPPSPHSTQHPDTGPSVRRVSEGFEEVERELQEEQSEMKNGLVVTDREKGEHRREGLEKETVHIVADREKELGHREEGVAVNSIGYDDNADMQPASQSLGTEATGPGQVEMGTRMGSPHDKDGGIHATSFNERIRSKTHGALGIINKNDESKLRTTSQDIVGSPIVSSSPLDDLENSPSRKRPASISKMSHVSIQRGPKRIRISRNTFTQPAPQGTNVSEASTPRTPEIGRSANSSIRGDFTSDSLQDSTPSLSEASSSSAFSLNIGKSPLTPLGPPTSGKPVAREAHTTKAMDPYRLDKKTLPSNLDPLLFDENASNIFRNTTTCFESQLESTPEENAVARTLLDMRPRPSSDQQPDSNPRSDIPPSDIQGALTSLGEDQWLSSTAVELLLKSVLLDSVRIFDSSYLSTSEPEKIFDKQPLRFHGESIWVIPLNHNNRHWTLAFIELDRFEVEVYDSLGGDANRHLQQATETLNKFMTFLLEHHPKLFRDGSPWKIRIMDCPRQANGYDCGVCVVVFAYYRILGLSLPKTVDFGLWRRILRQSLNGNKLDEDVMKPSKSQVPESQTGKVSEEDLFQDARNHDDETFEQRLRQIVRINQEEIKAADANLTLAHGIENIMKPFLERTTELHNQISSEHQIWHQSLEDHKKILAQYHKLDFTITSAVDGLEHAITYITENLPRSQNKIDKYGHAMTRWRRALQTYEVEHSQRSARAQKARDVARNIADKIQEYSRDQEARLARINEMAKGLAVEAV